MAVHTITPPAGHSHRDPIEPGTRRLLQDRRTVVTVTAVTGDTVHWRGDDGTRSYTPLARFAAITTPVDGPGDAA